MVKNITKNWKYSRGLIYFLGKHKNYIPLITRCINNQTITYIGIEPYQNFIIAKSLFTSSL